MAMVVDLKSFPSSYILNFDEFSNLREKEHEETFYFAIHKFVLGVGLMVGDSAQIFISEEKMGKDRIFLNGWITLSELLVKLDQFSKALYYSEDNEFFTKLKAGDMEYVIYFNSDPVAFGLMRGSKKFVCEAVRKATEKERCSLLRRLMKKQA